VVLQSLRRKVVLSDLRF